MLCYRMGERELSNHEGRGASGARRRKLSILGFAALLSSCGSPPTPFPDYCDTQHRVIPREERITSALVYVATNDYNRKLTHFALYRKSNKNRDTHAIAFEYLKKFPACCKITDPWVVKNYRKYSNWYGDNESFHAFFEANAAFRWAKDIEIVDLARDRPIKPVIIQSSSCGHAKYLGRG